MSTATALSPAPVTDIEVRRVSTTIKQSRVSGRFSYLVVIPVYQFKARSSAGQDWLEDEAGLRGRGYTALETSVEGDRARDDLLRRMEADGLRVVELWRKPSQVS